MKNTMEVTVFYLFENLLLNIAYKCCWLWIAIPKLSGNTSYMISNVFLEAFLKSQTIWQWQWHYGKYYRNHFFLLSDNLPLNIT